MSGLTARITAALSTALRTTDDVRAADVSDRRLDAVHARTNIRMLRL